MKSAEYGQVICFQDPLQACKKCFQDHLEACKICFQDLLQAFKECFQDNPQACKKCLTFLFLLCYQAECRPISARTGT